MKKFGLGLCGLVAVASLAGCPQQPANEVIINEKKVIKHVTPAPAPVVVVTPAPVAKPAATPKTAVTPTPKPLVMPTAVPLPTLEPIATPTPTPKPKPVAIKPKPAPTPKLKLKATPLATSAPPRSNALVVRAEIIEVSKVPDPRKVAYKNSIVFFKYKVLSVESGKYEEKELKAAHWGMRDKKLLAASRYKVGDVQTLQIELLDNYPDIDREVHNDDTSGFDLDPYWVKSLK